MSRQIDERGDLITTKESELEKLPFSARTPRVTIRSKTQLDSKPKPRVTVSTRSKISSVSDLRAQVRELVEDGVHSTVTKKKDDTIQQLGSMLLQQIFEGESLQGDLQRATSDGQTLRSELELSHRQSSEQEQTNARVRELRHLKSIADNEALVSDIRGIEADINKFLHVSEPWLLQDIVDGDRENQFEALVNLKFRRLEDLVYALRRQILRDREVIDLMPFVTSKFGSLRALIAKYDEALDTIERLKVREFKYSMNELVKRRQLGNCDIPTLHLLIVALQNELIESTAQVRSMCQALGGARQIAFPEALSENPVDFDLITQFNLLEANHTELQRRYDNMRKDYDLLVSQANLEADIATFGPFKMNDQVKQKLSEANSRIVAYHEKITKLQSTIDLQQRLVDQFQKEKAATLRQKLCLIAEISQLKEKVTECEGEVRTVRRKLDAIRGLARIMVENSLVKRKSYLDAFETVNVSFFAAFERFDSAALLIQRTWRHHKNPALEKSIVQRKMTFPIAELMTLSAVDVIAGKFDPITYRQIVKLLSSYNTEMKGLIQVPLAMMKERMVQTRTYAGEICERVLCRGKRFAWTQTDVQFDETGVQTDGAVRSRPPRGR
jgi:hypothetical protein